MLTYPAINPVAFHIYTWPVYWYGITYLVGFLAGWGLLTLRIRAPWRGFTPEQLADVIFYTMLGVILGGRFGYMIFYNFHALIYDPWVAFEAWKGGMSFHGGLIGVLIALWLCTRKIRKPFLALTDFIAPVVPIGLGMGRLGNFINGELWGRVTTAPWGMVFPGAGPWPRHPSQLYEFALEGVLLFILLWAYSRRPRPLGAVSGLFAIGYSVFRIIVECFREPDAQIGYFASGWLTEGQLLSLPLLLIGIFLMVWAYRKERRT